VLNSARGAIQRSRPGEVHKQQMRTAPQGIHHSTVRVERSPESSAMVRVAFAGFLPLPGQTLTIQQPWVKDCTSALGTGEERGESLITESQNSRGWKGPLWVI